MLRLGLGSGDHMGPLRLVGLENGGRRDPLLVLARRYLASGGHMDLGLRREQQELENGARMGLWDRSLCSQIAGLRLGQEGSLSMHCLGALVYRIPFGLGLVREHSMAPFPRRCGGSHPQHACPLQQPMWASRGAHPHSLSKTELSSYRMSRS